MLAVKSGFILFIKNYQFPLQINTLERERQALRQAIRLALFYFIIITGKARAKENTYKWVSV